MKFSSYFKNISIHNYLAIFCFIIAFFAVIFAFNNVNLFQIDFGGHIASTSMFQKYGLHGWNPNWFHGLINNLFYPPLEDILVWIIYTLSSLSSINSFLIYVALIIFGYWFAVYKIIRTTKTPLAAILMFLGLLIYFFIDKTQRIVYFQGGGFFDLLFSGLTSQGLGMIFFLLLVSELFQKTVKFWKLSVYTILAFLSHLVIGPFAFFLLLMYLILNFTKKNLSYFLISIGITSLVRLPFITYKSLGVSGIIYFNPPILLLVLLGITMYFAYIYKHKAALLLSIGATCIILPNYISSFFYFVFGIDSFFPDFHYYRFATLTLVSLVISAVFLFDYWADSSTKTLHFKKVYFRTTSVFFALLFVMGAHFSVINFANFHNVFSDRDNTDTDISSIEKNYGDINNGKKIFTVDMYRPIDFGLDSYFQYNGYSLPFVKGLFWESSRGNQLLSSYIATLLNSRDIVLEHYISRIKNQQQYNQLWDGFIDNYDIGWLFVASPQSIKYLTGNHLELFSNAILSGSTHYNFFYYDQMTVQGADYAIYKIAPKFTDIQQPSFLRYVTSDTKLVALRNKHYFADQILSLYQTESFKEIPNSYIFFDQDKYPLQSIPVSSGPNTIPRYTLSDQNTYKIHLGKSSEAVVIRIPDLPGWKITGLQGQDVRVFDGVYEKIIVGTGDILVSYHKPFPLILSYILSIVSVVLFVGFGIAYKRN